MTKNYYNLNAKEFIENTLNVDLKEIYTCFETYLSPGVKILDVGFGSGRDSLHFYQKGYQVVSIDNSEQIYKRGKTFLSNEVLFVDFFDVLYNAEFEGIWASAVFLHFTNEQIIRGLSLCHNALKENGLLYLSFKYGKEEVFRHGRYFNDFDENKWAEIMSQTIGWREERVWVTADARPEHAGKKWLNVILRKI
jgi:SAM-dependent methyltransferase